MKTNMKTAFVIFGRRGCGDTESSSHESGAICPSLGRQCEDSSKLGARGEQAEQADDETASNFQRTRGVSLRTFIDRLIQWQAIEFLERAQECFSS